MTTSPSQREQAGHLAAAAMAETGVSVIVCAYTEARWNDLCETIDTLKAQLRKPDEIILVIDNNDALLARAQAHFAGIRTLPSRLGRGLSAARNTGIAASSGFLVAFVDDDATLEPDVVGRLEAASLKPGALGATARILPDWVGARPAWFPDEYLWTVGCSHEPSTGRLAIVRNVTGAACIFRRDVFARCGVFSQALGRGKGQVPVSCEETELCIRARLRFPDGHFLRDDAALVHHKVPAARLTWRYFLLRCYAEGLSKGRLREMLSSGAAFATERSYVRAQLAPAIGRALLGGAFGRAAALGLGLGAAGLGYVLARFASAGGRPVGDIASGIPPAHG